MNDYSNYLKHGQEYLHNALPVEDIRQAKKQHKTAVERQQVEDTQKHYDKNIHIVARRAVLELEKERALRIASLPPHPQYSLLQLELNDEKPVKLTGVDAFSTTRYHMLDDCGIDRADSRQQDDAKKNADDEEEGVTKKRMELDRKRTEQMERPRLRHRYVFRNDYEKMMLELSDMQRADRDRRQKIVTDIPKRMEMAIEKQSETEQTFEDMYMATTDFTGDLNLASDHHHVLETPSVTELLEASTLSEHDSIQDPSLPQVSAVLKELTKKRGEPAPAKHSEKVLRKLMNKIESQRADWMSKCPKDYSELNQPLGEGHREMFIPVRDDDTPVKDVPVHDSVENIQKGMRPEVKPWSPTHQNGYSQQMQAVYHIQSPSNKQGTLSSPEILDRDGSLLENKANTSIQIGHKNPLLQPMLTAAMLQGQLIHGQITEVQVDNRNEDKNEDKTSKAVRSILEQQKQIEKQKRLLEEKLQELLCQQQSTVTPSRYATRFSPSMQQVFSSTVPPSVAYQTGHQHPGYQLRYMQQQNQFLPPNLQQPMMLPVTPAFTVSTGSSAHRPALSTVPDMQMAAPVHYYQHPFPKEKISAYAMNGNATESSYQGQITWSGVALSKTVTTANRHTDHMRKIKEYQHQLLARHEHSKKVLADTRNEIEKRRKELLLKFPQLSSLDKNSERIHHQELLSTLQVPKFGFQPGQTFGMPTYSHFVNATIIPTPNQPQMIGQPVKYTTLEMHPSHFLDNRPLKNGFIDQLRQVPTSTIVDSLPENTQNVSSTTDSVRKSLSFNADDSCMHSLLEPIHCEFRQDMTTPSLKEHKRIVTFKEEMNTTISSSERDSPCLTSHKNLCSSESGDEMSLIRIAKEQCKTFENKKQELQSQLDDIQKQKNEILRKHEISQIRIKTEQNRLKSKLIQAVAETQQEMLIKDVYESDEEFEKSQSPATPKPVFPNQLSMIPEVDTPVSAILSETFLSSNLSLSSSEGSVTARSHGSLDISQRLPAMRELQYSPEVINKVAADTGYRTSEIEEILKKAKEFDASLSHLLKQQTSDSIKHQDDSDGHMTLSDKSLTPESLSNKSLTPESLSTGCLDSQNVSRTELQSETSFPSKEQREPVFEIKSDHEPHWLTMLNSDGRPTDSSTLNFKPWADKFELYKENVKISEPDSSLKVVEQHHHQDIDQTTRLEDATFGNLRNPHSDTCVTDNHIPSLTQHSLPDKYPNINKSTGFGEYVDIGKQTDIFADSIVSSKYRDIDKQTTGVGNEFVDVKDTSNIDLSRHAKSNNFQNSDRILGTEFPPSGEIKIADLLEYSVSEQSETPELSQYPISDATETSDLSQYPLSEDENLSSPKSTPEQLQPSSVDDDQLFSSLQSDHNGSRPADSAVTVQNSVEQMEDLLTDLSTLEVAKITKPKHEHKITNSLNVNEAVKFPLDLSKYSVSVDNASINKSGNARREAKALPVSSSETNSPLTCSSETSDMIRDSGSFPILKGHGQNMALVTGISNLDTAITSWQTSQIAKTAVSSTVGISSFANSAAAFGGTSLSMATTDFSMSGFSKLHTVSEPSDLTESSKDSSLQDHSLLKEKLGYLFERTSHTVSDVEPVETSVLGACSILSDVDMEDESYVHKKFASLDKLLAKSKDLTARHRRVVEKNKKRELQENKKSESILSESEEKSSLAEPILSSAQKQLDLSSCDTHTGLPGLSDDGANLIGFDDDSLDFTDTAANKQQGMNLSVGPLSSFSNSQIFENETGISDEPVLNLVTLDSEISLNQEMDKAAEPVTDGVVLSSGSSSNSLSFEELEIELDTVDLESSPEASPSDACLSKEETIASPRDSNNSAIVSSNQGESDTTVFHAVPVLVDVPKLSMTMQADSKPKPPPKRPAKIDIKKLSDDESPASWASLSDETKSPQVPASPTRKGNFNGLNKALQPRMTGRGMAGLGMARQTEFGEKIRKFESSSPTSPAETPKQLLVDSAHKEVSITASVDSNPRNSTTGTAEGISNTLSSWTKSRGIKKDPPPVPPKTFRRGMRVLQSSPLPERQSTDDSNTAKNEAYEKRMRAYNPRLFRLCSHLDEGDTKNKKADKTDSRLQFAANRDKVQGFHKKLQETMKRNQQKEK